MRPATSLSRDGTEKDLEGGVGTWWWWWWVCFSLRVEDPRPKSDGMVSRSELVFDGVIRGVSVGKIEKSVFDGTVRWRWVGYLLGSTVVGDWLLGW